MKERYLFLTAFFIMFSLSACTPSPLKTLSIHPADFSKETQKVLDIVKDELAFFEYSTDETVSSCSIDLWQCENSQWVNAGKAQGAVEPGQHSLALQMADGVSIFSLSPEESGFTESHYDLPPGIDECVASGNWRLDRSIPIELEKEIPLWVMLGYDGHEMETGDFADFRSAPCAAGIAVTITFSAGGTE